MICLTFSITCQRHAKDKETKALFSHRLAAEGPQSISASTDGDSLQTGSHATLLAFSLLQPIGSIQALGDNKDRASFASRSSVITLGWLLHTLPSGEAWTLPALPRMEQAAVLQPPTRATVGFGGPEHLHALVSKLTCCSVATFPATPAAAGEQTRITWVLRDSSYSRDRHGRTINPEKRLQLCWAALPNPAAVTAQGVPLPVLPSGHGFSSCTILTVPHRQASLTPLLGP